MKKVRMGDLRKSIREEYLRGVPEFVLRQATDKYIDEIRRHVFNYILMNKSQTDVDRRAALTVANEVLDELKEEAFALLEDKLYQFVRNV